MKKVLFTATVDSHILAFHLPYLKYFKESGYEVHVATNGDEKIPCCDVKHIVSFERNPFKLRNLKAIKQLKKVIEAEKFDIIHCHTPMGSVVTRLAAKKSRKCGTRVIYTAHGFHFYKGAPKLNWILFYPVEKYLSRHTDTLITINKEDYDLARRKFKKCRQIEFVPGVGISEEKFDFKLTKKERLELRKSLGLKEKDFVMIYPARLEKNKNQIILIEVMKKLKSMNPEIKLLLAGEDRLDGYYHQIVEKYELQDTVYFLGYRTDIPELMKISDLSISASIREGLGVNLIEGVLSGLPVIATHNRGHNEIIIKNINGIFVDFDVDDIVNKVIHLKNNPIKVDRSSIEKFLLNNVKKEMIRIYINK